MRAQLEFADYFVIAVYLAFMVLLGSWVSFRKNHSQDLFLGGRRLRWWGIGLSMFATNLSAGALIGSAGIAYSSGLVGANLGLLAWPFLILLSMIFIPFYLKTRITSLPEFLRVRFGNSTHRLFAFYTLAATLVMWLSAVLYGGSLLVSQFLEWPLMWSIAIILLLSMFFAIAGGLNTVVATDSFQIIVIMFGMLFLLVSAAKDAGSVEHVIANTPPDYWKLFRPSDDPLLPWHAIVLGYPIVAIWFYCADQTMVQRVLAARDLENGQKGVLFAMLLKAISPIFFFLPAILFFSSHPDLANQDRAYTAMVMQYLPSGLVGLMAVVVFSTVVSTLTSGLNSFSTVFAVDIYGRLLRPDASQARLRLVGRFACLAAGLSSTLIAYSYSLAGRNFFTIAQSLNAFLAPPVTTVFLFGVFWNRANDRGAAATLLMGGCVSAAAGVMYFMQWPKFFDWPPFLLNAAYLFVICSTIMIATSISTARTSTNGALPSLREAYRDPQITSRYDSRIIGFLWTIFSIMMVGIYIVFN